MARKHLLLGSLFVAAVLVPTFADAKLGGASGPQVTFTAVGPAGLKIEGKSNELSVSEDGTNVTIAVPLGNLKTGIDLRDKHMREKYLEVAKYPNAELSVPRASLKVPASGSASGAAQGTMKIHGKTKSVTFNYTASRSGAKFDVAGDVHVNINDYGIEVPSYLGVTVKPDVAITVKFSAVDG